MAFPIFALALNLSQYEKEDFDIDWIVIPTIASVSPSNTFAITVFTDEKKLEAKDIVPCELDVVFLPHCIFAPDGNVIYPSLSLTITRTYGIIEYANRRREKEDNLVLGSC